jgi:chromosome segregation ATPase
MKKFVLLVGVSVIAAIGIYGCGDGTKARVEVAKEKALKQLDELLGSMDVKRKEIDLQVQGLKQAITGIGKAKIKAQVKLEELNRKGEPLQAKQGEIDATLKKYRDYLAKNEPVELAGQTLTPDQLKANAEKLIAARKQYTDEIASYDKSKVELQKVVTGFEAKQKELNAQLTALQSKIAQIDSQMVAVRSLQEAKAAMGDGDASLGENVAHLEDKVNDLLADIRVELATEGQMFDEAAATKEIDSIDSIISAAQGPKDTLSEIDRILEGGK